MAKQKKKKDKRLKNAPRLSKTNEILYAVIILAEILSMLGCLIIAEALQMYFVKANASGAFHHESTSAMFWILVPITAILIVCMLTADAKITGVPIIADKQFRKGMPGRTCVILPIFGAQRYVNSTTAEKIHRRRKKLHIAMTVAVLLTLPLIIPAARGRYEFTYNGITRYSMFGTFTNEYPAESYKSVELSTCRAGGRYTPIHNSFQYKIVTQDGKKFSLDFWDFDGMENIKKFHDRLNKSTLTVKDADKAEEWMSEELTQDEMKTLRYIFGISQ